MSKILRFPSDGKRRVVRSVIRRAPTARTIAPKSLARQQPTRVMQQPIARRNNNRPEIDAPGTIAVYDGFEFDHELRR